MTGGRTLDVLIVTGVAGAGKTTTLKTLEDLGWETIDNVPLSLLERLLRPDNDGGRDAAARRPMAIGVGTLTRDFDPDALIRAIDRLRAQDGIDIGTLFLDCSGDELERRYAETRRRHPLGEDRPARDGIEQERALMAPLRGWASRLINTTKMKPGELAQQLRQTFARDGARPTTLTVMSFGFSRGVPPGADLVFDMRFLRNPHWEAALRARTGQDAEVAAYIAADPAYDEAMQQIEGLLLLLVPRYHLEGKPYVTVAFGCTGGKHRSVHAAERVAARLRAAGFSPTIVHRDMAAQPQDTLEGRPQG